MRWIGLRAIIIFDVPLQATATEETSHLPVGLVIRHTTCAFKSQGLGVIPAEYFQGHQD